jgi:hypothetical protein
MFYFKSKNRVVYHRLEEAVINCLVKFNKNDRLASLDFLNSIKISLNKNIVENKHISTFTVSLILTHIQTIQKQYREKLMMIFIDSIEKLIEIEINCCEHKWLSTIMGVKSKTIVRRLISSLEYNRLIDSQNVCYKSLIELSMSLLDKYGVSSNKFSDCRTTIEDYLTFISTSILKDLFRNCIESRELICKCLLNELSSNNDVYIGNYSSLSLSFSHSISYF